MEMDYVTRIIINYSCPTRLDVRVTFDYAYRRLDGLSNTMITTKYKRRQLIANCWRPLNRLAVGRIYSNQLNFEWGSVRCCYNLNALANTITPNKAITMCKFVLIAITHMCLLLLPLPVCSTLHNLPEIFDFSNVDLVNFQYFKNLASQDPRTGAQASPILVHFQKKKAVLDYIERLFLGNSPFTQHSEIPFDPHFGRAWRPTYEKKFGHRGERLIAALGSGYSVKQLRHFGAIPKRFGMTNYPS